MPASLFCSPAQKPRPKSVFLATTPLFLHPSARICQVNLSSSVSPKAHPIPSQHPIHCINRLRELACNGSRAPLALAAIILCATAQAQTAPRVQDAAEEVAVRRAFLDWYRRLVAFEARDTVLQVNHQLGLLVQTLPSAARVLESVRDEADREESALAPAK
jgi:hypothetical protein